jgi:hypothetical protein
MNRLVWFVAVQWDMPGELHAKNVLAQIQRKGLNYVEAQR